MKYLAICALIAALAVIVCGNNSTWGTRSPSDILLFKTNVVKNGQWNGVVSYNATFPARVGANKRIITQVRAIDLVRNGTGGYATLNRGGPGFRTVTVIFQSLRSKGIQFNLEVWSRK